MKCSCGHEFEPVIDYQHKLICGDCTDATAVARVMGGEIATLAPVDPPYNVGFDYDGATVDDSKAAEAYEQFSRAWFGLCQSVSDRQIVTPGAINFVKWVRWFDAKHIAPRIVANTQVHGKVTAFWAWEPIFFFGEKFPKRRHTDVFDYASNYNSSKDTANHPCPKPLPLWLDLVENYSDVSDVVYEAFSGSGTTIIACENLGRRCRACEISPGYVGVALERWSVHTSRTPVLLDI